MWVPGVLMSILGVFEGDIYGDPWVLTKDLGCPEGVSGVLEGKGSLFQGEHISSV